MNFTPLKQASKEELLTRYDNGVLWLDSHYCQTGTNNTLDISGNIYDPQKYEACCKTLGEIEEILDQRFTGWRIDREVKETIVEERIQGFKNGYFNLSQLNPAEQLKILMEAFPGSKIINN
jgi:hypothetical protein